MILQGLNTALSRASTIDGALAEALRNADFSATPGIDPALLKSVLPESGRLVVRTLPFTYTQFGAFAGVL